MVTPGYRTTALHASERSLFWLSGCSDNNINYRMNNTFIYVGSHLILKKPCKLTSFPHDTDEKTDPGWSYRFLNAELRHECMWHPYLEMREWKIRSKSLPLTVGMIIVAVLTVPCPNPVLFCQSCWHMHPYTWWHFFFLAPNGSCSVTLGGDIWWGER